MSSLAVKYRPQTFNEMVSQESVIKVLERQLELKSFVNCYLFNGPSGTGKTTIARAFANRINNGVGTPIEIDAASNNGVDNIRTIISLAKERALDSEYKIIILDEVHMLTTNSWNALLKLVEEPPTYTIFMFCTTNPEKIPNTILNRVMQFKLNKIPSNLIRDRLEYICKQENYTNYEESITYISKISNGGMRNAIATLEKCVGYSSNLDINNVLKVLGTYSYEELFNLTNSIIDCNETDVLLNLDKVVNSGLDVKQFVDTYIEFVFDLLKYIIFKSMNIINIPSSMEELLRYTVGIENNHNYFSRFLDKLFEMKNIIKTDSTPALTIQLMILQFIRGV